MAIPKHVPLVITTRGDLTECVHHGSIAVVDLQGRLLAGVGDAQALNFTRSSLKPLQVLPFVEDDGLAHWGFGSHELAVMCASHGGEPVHTRLVARILARIGAGVGDLQCGCHPPSFYAATGQPVPAGGRWNALHHNCSGKHSGFLAFCRLHGQPLHSYLDADAPLQRRIRERVQGVAGCDRIAMGIDGCSAPNYAVPLAGLARAFARLATGEGPALTAIGYAMRRHPDLVSGAGRFDLALMQTGVGDWVSKAGADGMQAIGVASRGIGIAIRIADGNPRAVRVATVAVLQGLGLLCDAVGTPLAPLLQREITNFRGTVVGRVEPAFAMPAVRA